MKALIVDFNNLWNRYYYAMQGDIEHIHARLYGILEALNYSTYYSKKLLILDGNNSIKSKLELLPTYKGGRSNKDKVYSTMYSFLKEVKDKLHTITIAKAEEYEADEVIAVLSYRYAEKGYNVYIYSNDKDLLQLKAHSPLIEIGSQFTNGLEITPFTKSEILNRFKVPLTDYSQIIKFRVLRGDSSDKIPPVVPRMTSKTIIDLITTCWIDSELLISDIDSLCSSNERIKSNKASLIRNWNLMYLNPHTPLSSLHVRYTA